MSRMACAVWDFTHGELDCIRVYTLYERYLFNVYMCLIVWAEIVDACSLVVVPPPIKFNLFRFV